MDEPNAPLNNPWLAAPKPEGLMTREALEDRILNLLSSQNMAVIATVAPDGSPAATPVRYSSLGLEIMYTSWRTSPKSRNLRLDPRISVGIFAPLVGPASSRGVQLFGTARTLERDHPEADRYWSAFRWQADHVESGRSLAEPPTDPLTVVTPDRVLYTEHWLGKRGFSPRQEWLRDAR
jgi:general stress protein 26